MLRLAAIRTCHFALFHFEIFFLLRGVQALTQIFDSPRFPAFEISLDQAFKMLGRRSRALSRGRNRGVSPFPPSNS
ncbi:hypothetical protein C8J57DRAFT_1337707 [Mycena rebaudengoi]|nr:hypothetical protein C8J57DRAFT_1337707 [Mycena rebaudengoi]